MKTNSNKLIISFIIIGFYVFVSELQAQTQSLVNRLNQIAQLNETVGYSTALITKDSTFFQFNSGLRDIQRALPINDSTYFRMASISKTISALSVLRLVEQNRLNLDSDVSLYLGFELRNPYFPTQPITTRRLLSHTSSLRDSDAYDIFLSATFTKQPIPSLQQLVMPGQTFYKPSVFSSEFGPESTYFTYSNLNYAIVGTILERITGLRFDDYCRDSVLAPLGIPGGFTIQDVADINQVAVLYRFSSNRWRPQADFYEGIKPEPRDLHNYVPGTNALLFSPQGGLRTTVKGLSRIIQLLLSNGVYNGTRMYSDQTLPLLMESEWVFTGTNGDTFYDIFETYALGTHTTEKLMPGYTLTGHPGEAYGLISDMYIEREHGFGIIFVSNGGRWDFGSYSGWYSIEEQVFKAWSTFLETQPVSVKSEMAPKPETIQVKVFPNPFNPTATIEMQIPKAGFYSIQVMTVLGQHCGVLQQQYLREGTQRLPLQTQGLASGAYLLYIRGDAGSTSVPFQIIK